MFAWVLFALVLFAGVTRVSAPASADPVSGGEAVALVTGAGNQLVSLINQGGDTASRRAALQTIIDSDVDVDGVAKFCLGRFWRTATPPQQQDYLNVFHAVLMRNMTADLGDYQGVTFMVGMVTPRGDGSEAVETVLTRPNNAPNNVQWVVADIGGSPKIIDVIVEGTSMRITTRSEYASYLQNNSNDLNALIAALKAKASG